MDKNYLISIIVPVYNVEEYLDRCIESIVKQTYKNLEIILVDDGSPDKCPEICEKWAECDERIRVIHKKNDGLANARNSGIEVSNGDYLIFTDSDDYMDPDMIEFLLNLSLKYDADVSRCGFYFNYENIDKKRNISYESIQIPDYNERIIDLATTGYGGVAWNKLYKRDIIKEQLYDKADGCSEDIMHNFRVYKDAKKVVFSDIPKYHYVIRNGSITNDVFDKRAFDIIRAKKIILDNVKDNEDVLPYAVKGYIMSAFIVLSGCIQNNMFFEERQELIKDILSYKKEILSSNLYSKLDKIKTLILFLSPDLYEKIIKRKNL